MRMRLVDGGQLSNFPIDAFDRTDHQPPRWPTFGIKLSARPGANQVANEIHGAIDLAKALIGTMANAHDQMHIDQPCVARRTIFVDTIEARGLAGPSQIPQSGMLSSAGWRVRFTWSDPSARIE
jgi:NTE family protein